MKNGSNIESRKNRRKCRSLTYTYINFKEWKYKIVSNILSIKWLGKKLEIWKSKPTLLRFFGRS